MPDFGEALNLEELSFRGCIQLREIHSSIGVLRNLTLLNLKDCECLVKIPDFREASNLKRLDLAGCIQLKEIHESIGFQRRLTYLNLKNCENLVSLPNSLLGLSSLERLNLFGCSNLYKTQLLEEIKVAKHFKKPCCIREAPIHSQPTSSIQKKSFRSSVNCLLLSSPSFPCMRYLDLSFCNLYQIPDAIGNLCCLERLRLMGNNFKKIPSLKKLSKLVYINLQHCKRLKYLFELPSQTDLTPENYSEREELEDWSDFDFWPKEGLNTFNCPKLVGSDELSRMSISWMIQILKVLDEHCFTDFGFESVIPGNEIPRWFNNQHEGTSNWISVDGDETRLMQDDNDWIGIAFCVVFCVSHQNNSIPRTEMEGRFRRIPVLLDVDLVTDKSDHMFLFYNPRSPFIHLCKREGLLDSDDIEVELKTAYPDWDVEVKKYGYRWVYEQDLQLSNIPSKHCKNSSNRKRKFVEIKEKQ